VSKHQYPRGDSRPRLLYERSLPSIAFRGTQASTRMDFDALLRGAALRATAGGGCPHASIARRTTRPNKREVAAV
jgi:hypothetical protein